MVPSNPARIGPASISTVSGGPSRVSMALLGRRRALATSIRGPIAPFPLSLQPFHPARMRLVERRPELLRRQRGDAEVERLETSFVGSRQSVDREHGRIAPDFRVLLVRLRFRRNQEI